MRQWSDSLIHPALRADAEVLRRARLTVQLSSVLIGIALAYAVFYAAVIGYTAGAGILAAGAASVVVALAMLRTRPWLRAGGNLVTGIMLGTIVGLVVCEGGIRALATPLLATPPIVAILLLGRRGAATWTALCVATIVGFGVADAMGVRFPPLYPAEWEARMSVGSPVGLVLCTALLLFVVEKTRAEAQARADAATAALGRLAYQDALTGLANRAQFMERLDVALSRAYADGAPGRVAVLLLDLDGFKRVNDTMGHATGDALLAKVAERLLNATRGCDTVARLGGDEFAVLIDGVRQDGDAIIVAERIVASVARPYALDAGEAVVGTSLGIARGAVPEGWQGGAAPAPPRGADAAMLHHADLAMYRAKTLGKGRWVLFEPGLLRDLPEAPAAPATPRHALDRAQLGLA